MQATDGPDVKQLTSNAGTVQKGNMEPEKTLVTLTVKDGQYHCSECDVRGQGHAFEEHIMCHIMLNPYQCLYCSQCFTTRRQVSCHVQKQHAGQKMNCALKALNGAKRMMKAALESGKHQFYALVPGKVPLVKTAPKSEDKCKNSSPSVSSYILSESDSVSGESRQSTPKSNSSVNSSCLDLKNSTSETLLCETSAKKLSKTSEATQDGDVSSIEDFGDKNTINIINSAPNKSGDPSVTPQETNNQNKLGVVACCGMDGDVHNNNSYKTENASLQSSGSDIAQSNIDTASSATDIAPVSAELHTFRDTKQSETNGIAELNTFHDTKQTETNGIAELNTFHDTKQSETNGIAELNTFHDTKQSETNGTESAKAVHETSEEIKVKEKSNDIVDSSDTTEIKVLSTDCVSKNVLSHETNDSESKLGELEESFEEVRFNGTISESDVKVNENLAEMGTSEPCNQSEDRVTEDRDLMDQTTSCADEQTEVPQEQKGNEAQNIESEPSSLCTRDTDLTNTQPSSVDTEQDNVDELAAEQKELLCLKNKEGFDQKDTEAMEIDKVSVLDTQDNDNEGTNDEDSVLDAQDNNECTKAKSKDGEKANEVNASIQSELVKEKCDDLSSCQVKIQQFPPSNFEQNEEENGMGLKIVAAFSLQENDNGKQNSNEQEKNEIDQENEKLSSLTESIEIVAETGTRSSTESGTEPKPQTSHRTLGPPSKPIPSSSFLEMPSHSPSVTSKSQGSLPGRNLHFFVCGFACRFTSLTSLEFRDHLLVDHAGESLFSCFHCGYQSSSEDGLIRHISAHAHTYSKSAPLYICGASACKFGSNLISDFITHQSAWHPDLSLFHCHDCYECFQSVSELITHFEANFLHIINCPHCSAKTTERRTLLNHIASVHPGKPKMMSVAKQVVCRDRKLNNYVSYMHQRRQLTLLSESSSLTFADIILSNETSTMLEPNTARNKSLLSILSEPVKPLEKDGRKQTGNDQNSYENEPFDDKSDTLEDSLEEEQLSRSGTPSSSADDELNYKCNFCTFVARDPTRLEGHQRGHELPSSRKTRFKCMYCPQSFDNSVKFNSHVSCHPGLIQFHLYHCQFCDYDSNQRHVILKHAHHSHVRSRGLSEDSICSVTNQTIMSRVLECNHCSYMTRHRKHLVNHIRGEHSSPAKSKKHDHGFVQRNSNCITVQRGSNDQDTILGQNNTTYSFESDGTVKETRAHRFKCPICQYLVPRAADLKTHVERHSEIGEITVVTFRCKYCSAASTAREIVIAHFKEKHIGKAVSLVKNIMTIDTQACENNYAVTTSSDHEKDPQDKTSKLEYHETGESLVLVIPDSAGEALPNVIVCPKCSFVSASRQTILEHVSTLHPDVRIMGRGQNNELYPLDVSCSSETSSAPQGDDVDVLPAEVLIAPDSPVFDENLTCPKCDFSTLYRRDLENHLDDFHPEVSIMGHGDYPTFEGKGRAVGQEGMIIIGSGMLDDKIRCLYQDHGDRVQCTICHTYRPKKFFMHVHILRHLNVFLWGCQYCSHKGLQKYKMIDHIKKVHPKQALWLCYYRVNVQERVKQHQQRSGRAKSRGNDFSPAGNSTRSVDSGQDGSHLRKLSQDSLAGCIIGSEDLDMKLACLYSVGSDNRYRCVICTQEFQRKFAVHHHLVQFHLKVNLIGCGYCDAESMEKHMIVNHILESHKSEPISLRNLAADLTDRVAEFLGKMTVSADTALDSPTSSAESNNDFVFKIPELPNTPQALTSHSSSPFSAGSPRSDQNQPESNLLQLGKDKLDRHLQPMFKEMPGLVMKYRCLMCRGIFDRKYAIHRHLLMKHLKLGIIGCPYCPFLGVERYQVFTHIKEDHKEAELRVRHISLDMDTIVSEYMENVANGTVDPNSKAPPPWSVKKVVKKEEMEGTEEQMEDEPSSPVRGPGLGLVVAMFRKSGFTIKQEPTEDPEDDVSNLDSTETEEEEESGSVGSKGEGGPEQEDSRADHASLSLQKGVKLATDIHTNIRVLCAKQDGIKHFTCERCKFTSFHRSNVARHIYRVHEMYRQQECPVCHHKSLSQVLMEKHMRNEHPGIPFTPRLHNKGVKRKAEDSYKNSDAKKDGTISCESDPMDNIDDAETEMYECANCGFETKQKQAMAQHREGGQCTGTPMNGKEEEQAGADLTDSDYTKLVCPGKMNLLDLSTGPEDIMWQCFYCSYKTASEEDLKIHFAGHHPQNPFKFKKVPIWRFVCRSCHVKTRSHSKMRYHLNRHINYRPYTCTTCGSFFPSPEQCRKHCKVNNHFETFTYMKVARKEKQLQELLKECQEVALALATSSDDDLTVEPAKFSFSIPSKRKAKNPCPSSSLGKLRKMNEDIFSSSRGNGVGKESEDNDKMKCASCSFSGRSVSDVRAHFVEAHEGEEFRWKDSHTGHICTEMGEITNAEGTTSDLDPCVDGDFSTMGDGVLTCLHCPFTTATVQAIKSHLKTHLPKRFLCPYCSLRCSRRDTVAQHVRCAHRDRELWTIHFHLPQHTSPPSSQPSSPSPPSSSSPPAEDDDSNDSPDLAEPCVTFQVEEKQSLSSPQTSGYDAAGLRTERIVCGQCETRSSNIAAIYQHHQDDHPDSEFLWVDSSNGYTFNYMGEAIDAKQHRPDLFTKDGFIKEWDDNGTASFCCKTCHFSSSFIQAMKSHMKSHLPHGYICPHCSMTTHSREKLLSHQISVHKGKEAWVMHLRMMSEMGPTTGASMSKEKSKSSLPLVR